MYTRMKPTFQIDKCALTATLTVAQYCWTSLRPAQPTVTSPVSMQCPYTCGLCEPNASELYRAVDW